MSDSPLARRRRELGIDDIGGQRQYSRSQTDQAFKTVRKRKRKMLCRKKQLCSKSVDTLSYQRGSSV
jgi:hypothetical protein